MKKVIGLILFTVLLFVGCQNDDSIVGPTDQLNVESNSPKGRIITPNYISMPDDGLAKFSEDDAYWYYSQYVDDDDCSLVIETKYEGGIHGAVGIYANLSIDENAIDEEGYATLDISKDYGIVSFGPSEVFQSYAVLDLTFVGLDLSNISEPTSSWTLSTSDQPTVGFVLVNEDGTTQAVKNSGIKVDKSTGTLSVSGAIVYSSQEYAWVTE
jgi:hypothetical protein